MPGPYHDITVILRHEPHHLGCIPSVLQLWVHLDKQIGALVLDQVLGA
jgi:hypothetical protein